MKINLIVFQAFMEKIMPGIAWLLSLFVALSCIGSLNACYLSDTRYYIYMRDWVLPWRYSMAYLVSQFNFLAYI